MGRENILNNSELVEALVQRLSLDYDNLDSSALKICLDVLAEEGYSLLAPRKPCDAFLSYSRADMAEVKDFYQYLRRRIRGLNLWLDMRNVDGGDDYAQEIEDAIEDASFFILLYSVDSEHSAWVRKEVEMALNLHKRIIPVAIAGKRWDGQYKELIGDIDCINYMNKEQREKLVRNVSAWSGKIYKRETLPLSRQYTDIDEYHEGLARATRKGGKMGFLDRQGDLVIPCQFVFCRDFHCGRAMVYNGEKDGYIDSTGELVIPYQFDYAEDFSHATAIVKIGEKYGLIDTNGDYVLPCEYDLITSFKEGLSKIRKGSKTAFINYSGQVVIDWTEDTINEFVGGLARIVIDGKFGFIDRTGELVIPCQFDKVSKFKGGIAQVSVGDETFMIDRYGNRCELSQEPIEEAANPAEGTSDLSGRFSKLRAFGCGLAAAKETKKSKYGYIDPTGKMVIKPRFSRANKFSEGLAWALCYNPPQWQLLDTEGTIIATC